MGKCRIRECSNDQVECYYCRHGEIFCLNHTTRYFKVGNKIACDKCYPNITCDVCWRIILLERV